MLLETSERLRFAEYCRRQAEICRLISEKIRSLQGGRFDLAANREASMAAAFAAVADHLENVEGETIG